MRLVALLRGINVSGQRILRMEDLRRDVAALGYGNVTTLLASGNVLFDAPGAPTPALAARLEKKLGRGVKVILRTRAAIRALVAKDPFAGRKAPPDSHRYVTFLAAPPNPAPRLPLGSTREGVAMFGARGAEYFSFCFKQPNGAPGSPNRLLERLLKMPATTRNWNTVRKIAAAS